LYQYLDWQAARDNNLGFVVRLTVLSILNQYVISWLTVYTVCLLLDAPHTVLLVGWVLSG